MNPAFTESERTFLLKLARAAIQEHFSSGRTPVPEESAVAPALRVAAGCFVTLTRDGKLRGCIGNISPREPLFQVVMKNACGAAFRDTRFAPVGLAELAALAIEISVLSGTERLSFDSPEELLQRLRPGVDGVVLKMEGRTATFLPQVWEKYPDAVRFLDALAHKAMLPAAAWRDPGMVVLTYQVESFAKPQRD